MDGSAREHDRGERFVGAAVDREIDVHGEKFSVAADGGAVAGTRRMALGGCGHVLSAIVDHFDGLAGLPGEQRSMGGEHGRIFLLAAKAAAGFGLHNANTIFRQAEEADQSLVHVVGTLQRAPNRDAIRRIGLRDHALGFDVQLLLRAGFVLPFDDEIGTAPDLVDVALFH